LSLAISLTLTSFPEQVNDGVGAVVPTFGSAFLTSETVRDFYGGDGGFDGGGGDGSPAPAIPEPSSAVLLILGAAGMVARRRRL